MTGTSEPGPPTIYVAPTEPRQLRDLGTTSLLPERWGVDLCIFTRGLKIGVQRKEVADLLGSLDDGRLAMQLAQMESAPLDARVVLVEGEVRYTADGVLMGTWSGGRRGAGGRIWTRRQMVAVEWSVRTRGVEWARVDSLDATCAWVAETAWWWSKPEHKGIARRPAAPSAWGKARNHEWAEWMVQGVPGIGAELARRIVATYGMPVKWKVTAEELAAVPGISRQRAEKLVRDMNGDDDG